MMSNGLQRAGPSSGPSSLGLRMMLCDCYPGTKAVLDEGNTWVALGGNRQHGACCFQQVQRHRGWLCVACGELERSLQRLWGPGGPRGVAKCKAGETAGAPFTEVAGPFRTYSNKEEA